ncbi:MAG: tolB protein precursor [Cytophagales bacterium]|nr:tolB protein precursor [Cytophagales bacterium]
MKRLDIFFDKHQQRRFNWLFLGLVAAGLFFYAECKGQYFGQNKIGYRAFDFRTYRTDNFEWLYYFANDSVRNYWATQGEYWYQLHRNVLRDSIPFRNPILFYANHADFQQTNVTGGNLDPGTGGFAEGLKNRIVMPVMKANAQTDHVLGHEIVHALQFQMMAGGGDSLSIADMMDLPLWVVEGMAEYLSIGPVDAHTALWLRDAVAHDDLPTLADLTGQPRFFPYRWGHAFWAYVTGRWGEQTVRPLFLQSARFGYEAAIQRVLGVSVPEFNRMWHQALRESFVPFDRQPATAQAVLPAGAGGRMQLAPSVSPDGRYVAYLSEKRMFSIDLFLAEAKTGRVLHKLASTMRHAHFDAISYLESAGAWSPDSRRFAFVVFARGKNRLVILNVRNGRIQREIEVPGVPAFSNPAWSPDGRHIAMNGLVNGQNDLYLYDLVTGDVRQLTNDVTSELQPAWSPDGRTLVFVTDRAAKRDNRPHAFDHRLALYDLPTETTRILPVFGGANNLNPVFGTDNQTVYFLSDRDGHRNLYAVNPYSGALYQLTRYFTGITGITPHAPALSVARETGQVVYSVFERQGYRIYRSEPSELLWERVNPAAVDETAAILPPQVRFQRDFVAARLNATRPTEAQQPQLPPNAPTSEPYRTRFRLVHVGGSDVGLTGNRFGTALSGGVNAAWGDLLGNKTISGGLAVAGEITDVSGQVTYMNRKRRINWGVSLSHVPFRSGRQGFGRDVLEVEEGRFLPVDVRVTDIQRTFEQQLSLFSYLPFSRTRRLEVSASASRFFFRTVRTNEFFFQGRRVGSERERLPDQPDVFTGQVGTAYVGDNSVMGPVSPLKGHRFRFGVETTFGPVQMHTVTADYRRYYRLNPVTFAVRGLYTARYGRDATSGFLPPLFVGFPTLVRGYAAATYERRPYQGEGDVWLNDLQGSRMAVANAELRLSLSGPSRLALLRSGKLPSELNFFADGGMAWGRAWPGQETARPVPVVSTGMSLRVSIVGAMVLEPFYAIPWQRSGMTLGGGTLGLNIAAGW